VGANGKKAAADSRLRQDLVEAVALRFEKPLV
jgi:hypothetical protein